MNQHPNVCENARSASTSGSSAMGNQNRGGVRIPSAAAGGGVRRLPSVCAIMLANGRAAMVKQAVDAFKAQTYQRKILLVYDSGEPQIPLSEDDYVHVDGRPRIHFAKFYSRPARSGECAERTIGALRNEAIAVVIAAVDPVDIIVHWDSDDWSHPRRIEEQVDLLEASGADAVGYNQMTFWREAEREAWLYTGSILGTSLCYWQSAWERRPFPDKRDGEDTEWLLGIESRGVSSMPWLMPEFRQVPRMIARIHDGNSRNPAYSRAEMVKYPAHWLRSTEDDVLCKEVFGCD